MAVSIACPQCRSVMKSVNPIPAGKKVKCPKCAAVFNAPANGVVAGKPSASGTAGKPGVVPNKPSAAGAAKPAASKPAASGTAKPLASQGSAWGTAKLAKAGGTTDPRKRKGSKFKKILVLATLLLLAGGGLWVYSQIGGSTDNTASSSQASNTQPTKDNTPPPPKISDDPYFYLPPDSTTIAGVEPGTLMQVPVIKTNLDAVLKQGDLAMMLGELKRLSGLGPEDAERIVIAGTGAVTADRPESMVIVARTKAPVDAKKLAGLPDVIETKKSAARPYYTLKSSAATQPFEMRACCAPTDRLVVVAMGSAKRVEEAMSNPGTAPSLRPELLPILRKLEKAQVWTVVPLDDAMRKSLEPVLAAGPAMMPELADPLKALNQALAAGFWISADAKEVRVSAGVLCPTDAVARDLAGGLNVLWTKNKLPLQEKLQPIVKELPSDMRELIDGVFKSGAISADGELAAATIRFSMTPIEGLVKIAKAVGPDTLLASLAQAQGKAGPGAAAGGENEKALLALINKTREDEELPMLKPDAKLFAAALMQAKVAAKDGNFDGIRLEDILESVKMAGYQAQAVTANLGIYPGKEKYDPELTIKNWMSQEVPKNNLLNKEYNECGIGMMAGAEELFIILILTKK